MGPTTIIEAGIFTRRAYKLLDVEERAALTEFLAYNPEAGDVMEGLEGIRKVRFAAKGHGKSGGVRVIYFYYMDNAPLYALLIYGKGEQDDLDGDDRKTLRRIARELKREWKGKK